MYNFLRNTTFVFLLIAPALALATHGEANTITSINGDGNGVFNGTFVHLDGASSPHPWYTFCAVESSTVTITMESPAFSNGNYLWVYKIFDDNAEVGDINTVDFHSNAIGANSDDGGSNSTTLNFVPNSTGQHIVQLDSFLGGQGAYTLTISGVGTSSTGCTPTAIPTMSSWSLLVLFGLILGVGMTTVRRKI